MADYPQGIVIDTFIHMHSFGNHDLILENYGVLGAVIDYCSDGEGVVCEECINKFRDEEFNTTDSHGMKLFMILANEQHMSDEAVRLALKDCVDVNSQDNDGNTALHYLAERIEEDEDGDHNYLSQCLLNTIDLLLSRGANLFIRNNEGYTAYDLFKICSERRDVANPSRVERRREIMKYLDEFLVGEMKEPDCE